MTLSLPPRDLQWGFRKPEQTTREVQNSTVELPGSEAGVGMGRPGRAGTLESGLV